MALLGIYNLIPILNSRPEDFIPEEVTKVLEPLAVGGIIFGATPKLQRGTSSKSTSTEDFTGLDNQIESILTDLETYQTNNKLGKKYPSTNKSNSVLSYENLPFEIKVSEYVAPTGSGYFLEIWATINNQKYYKSVGYGVEALSRTQDWTMI